MFSILKRLKIFSVLGKRQPNRLIDNLRNRAIRRRRFSRESPVKFPIKVCGRSL